VTHKSPAKVASSPKTIRANNSAINRVVIIVEPSPAVIRKNPGKIFTNPSTVREMQAKIPASPSTNRENEGKNPPNLSAVRPIQGRIPENSSTSHPPSLSKGKKSPQRFESGVKRPTSRYSPSSPKGGARNQLPTSMRSEKSAGSRKRKGKHVVLSTRKANLATSLIDSLTPNSGSRQRGSRKVAKMAAILFIKNHSVFLKGGGEV